MPWDIVGDDEGCPLSTPWGVRLETGRLLSCHGSKREALAQVAALHANENLEGRLSGAAVTALGRYQALAKINLVPTSEMVLEAKRGLEWRAELKRGGGPAGLARAEDIVRRARLSPDTVRKMCSYFARHGLDCDVEGFKSGDEGFPSAARVGWALAGGDAGRDWAEARLGEIKEI
jgi:hypothetical protein